MLKLEGVSVIYRLAGKAGAGIAANGKAHAAGKAGEGDREGWLCAISKAEAVFPEGSLTALVGPSGCGKTSLLQAMAGLLPVSEGRILVHGEELHGVREQSAVIFQGGGLLPWKTVRGNAELPLVIRGMGARERAARVDPILEELGLIDFESFYPARLSGGMRQRLGVARALAQQPDLLLMDEPFSSLDALTRESLQDGLLEVRRRHLVTVVLVTHSIEEAAYLGERAYLMAGRAPGRIAACVEWPVREAKGAKAALRNEAFRSSEAYFSRCAALRRIFESSVAEAGRT